MEMDSTDGALLIQKQAEDEYKKYRYGKNAPKDVQKAISMMNEFFPGYSEIELEKRLTSVNLVKIFDKVIECFHKEYGFSCDDLSFNNLFQKDVVSYLYNDKDFPAFVHVDELFESSMLMFLLNVFKWSKEAEDLAKCRECFVYLVFLFNEVAVLGELPDENARREMLRILDGDEQLLQLAEGCYWTIMVFSVAHEVGHYYFDSLGKKYNDDSVQRELDADGVAYHIVLKSIMGNDGFLEEYSYLAPLMSLDFFDLYVYMYSLLHDAKIPDEGYPLIAERKDQLLSIVDKDIYELNTEEGNALYAGFQDVFDEFKRQSYEKKELGYFDRILKNRKDMENRNEQTTGN